MNLKNHPACRPFTEAGNLSQISAYYEEGRNIWMMLCSRPRPCFTQELVTDIITLARGARESRLPFDFWVTGSSFRRCSMSVAIWIFSPKPFAPVGARN